MPQKNFLSLISQLSPLESKLFKCRLDIEASGGLKWSLYFYLGRLMWSSGGTCPLERWQRLLNHYCPEINSLQEFNLETSQFEGYTFLYNVLKKDPSKRSQVIALVKATLIEVLFDILQYEHQLKQQQPNSCLSFTYDTKNYPKTVLTLAKIDQTLNEAQQQWQLWQQWQLTSYSPNLVPIIEQPERLRHNLQNSRDQYRILTKSRASPSSYKSALPGETPGLRLQGAEDAGRSGANSTHSPSVYDGRGGVPWIKLVDGKRTLRSLALELGQPLPNLTLYFVQYVNSGMMSFVEVQQARANKLERNEKDTLATCGKIEPLFSGNSSASRFTKDSTPLVMCIDDSSTVCTQMRQIITREGCRFLEIQDPITAIPTVLKIQPNLIFLDLVMPIVNGYELCAQIRRISQAKNIPIVILTGKDGLIDRVRAKLVGASDFLSKPVKQAQVCSILRKYALIQPKKTGK